MVKGLAIGKTCRANVPVHNAFCLMSFGLVAGVLVEINAWDRSGCFVTKFSRILIVHRGVLVSLGISPSDPIYFVNLCVTVDLSLFHPAQQDCVAGFGRIPGKIIGIIKK